jgi:hypothetical protein
LAQNEELKFPSRETGRRGGLGKRSVAMKKHRINAHPLGGFTEKLLELSRV